MGADDVLKVLEKNLGIELTSKEIAEATTILVKSVRRILKSLGRDMSANIKHRDLTFEEKKNKFGYVVNPIVRVYWLEDSDN